MKNHLFSLFAQTSISVALFFVALIGTFSFFLIFLNSSMSLINNQLLFLVWFHLVLLSFLYKDREMLKKPFKIFILYLYSLLIGTGIIFTDSVSPNIPPNYFSEPLDTIIAFTILGFIAFAYSFLIMKMKNRLFPKISL